MNKDIYLAAIAGLLHDIGKFMLRAAEGGTRTWDEEAAGDFKYKHAMLTASFVERYVPSSWRVEVKLAAGDHHNPQNRQDLAVSLADHLSAAERNDGTEDGDVRKTHPKQLLSIFTAIRADGYCLTEAEREQAYIPLAPLELKHETLFPAAALPEAKVWERYWQDLWLPFTTAADALKQVHEQEGDLSTYLESLLLLMQRYTWCIPSAYYKNRPDISLYDHSRMTAALAAIFTASDFDEATLRKLVASPETEQPLALLVSGDISGVQDFLYTISNRGATSALRGRSFYLQLLTEAIARFVLRRLELPITNLIYAGGGNFYLLARASDGARLQEIQREISRALLQHHRGELYTALAGTPLAGRDFFGGRISEKWGELAERLQAVKLHRFSELEAEELQQLFQPQGVGGAQERQCQVCGQEHPDTTEEDETYKCPTCRSFEKLGDKLRNASYLLLQQAPEATSDLEAAPGEWEDALACFGLHADVGRSVQDLNVKEERGRVVLALKDGALADLQPATTQAVGRRFLVNVTPILQEDEYFEFKDKVDDLPKHRQDGSWPDPVKPFSVLEKQSRGIERLGVLRMDVDNLGRLFSEGFKKKNNAENWATLSRVAALSSAISLYFDGWVEKLAEDINKESGCDVLYSIYSGGDDLFFVGSWNAVVEFARRVRAGLTPYAAHHPGIHASAGIELVGGKYPLAQAALDAGRAEEAAKSYQVWREGKRETVKDAVSFLGQVQAWERFGLEEECAGGHGSIHRLMHLLAEMVEGQNGAGAAAPKSLLRNLSNLYAQYAQAEEARRKAGEDATAAGKPQPLWGPWMWRGYYMLRRMAKRTKSKDIEALAEKLHDERFRDMDWIGLAARWAELLTR